MTSVNAAPTGERLSIRGIELEVLRRGTGRPLLLLHGFQTINPRAPFLDLLGRHAEEIGHEIYGIHLKEADDEEFDPVFEALIGLYARACRVAREVHHLLSGGFPFGALARSRTLHELAVITIGIADYGRDEAHADLADRFLQHAWIARYSDAEDGSHPGR